MKTRVEIKATATDGYYKAGETGYVDGYVIDHLGVACAVVVKDNGEFSVVETYNIRAVSSGSK